MKLDATVYKVADNVKLRTTRAGKWSVPGNVDSGSFTDTCAGGAGGGSTTVATGCFLLGMISFDKGLVSGSFFFFLERCAFKGDVPDLEFRDCFCKLGVKIVTSMALAAKVVGRTTLASLSNI